ncbi:MAG: hypothetical protein ACI8PT_003216 [Gammaproteobacteria bacterium]|jgi:hypothetical protein
MTIELVLALEIGDARLSAASCLSVYDSGASKAHSCGTSGLCGVALGGGPWLIERGLWSSGELATAYQMLSEQCDADGFEWVADAQCAQCHEVLRNESIWSVRPLEVPEHWLPGARFDHRRHTQTQRSEGHQATWSKSGRDVLIPGIEVCKACHASERRAGKVNTGCQSCHRWPRHGVGTALAKRRQPALC